MIEQSRDFITRLDLQQRKHEEIVTQLKQEIFRLEEFSESQQEQALKMEEEKAMVIKSLKALKYEIESERQSHDVEVNILSRKLENAENDVAKISKDLKRIAEERKLIQEDYEAQLSRAERKAESKISTLQSKLQDANAEHSSLQLKLSQLKEKLETQKKEFIRKSSDALAKLESKHIEQTKATRSKHKIIVENLHQELHAREEREKKLRDKLDNSSDELEAKVGQFQDMQIKEVAYKRKILAFETTEGQYINEVSELQGNITKLQAEISHMKSAAVAYRSRISDLKAEFQKDSDFNYSSLSNSRRSPTASESSKHGEIFTKIKEQLGELQKVLESTTSSGNGQNFLELELLDRLASNSSALEAEVQRMRQGMSAERLSHTQVCTQKDELLHKLQAVKDLQKNLITGLVAGTSEGIASQMDSLQSNCKVSLVRYSSQLEDALLKLAGIAKSLQDKDISHASALGIMLSDLDHKHKEINSCMAEISHLQQELETSHHSLSELTESQEQLQREREKEMHELQSKLEQAQSSVRVSSRHVKVDAGSGQVISEHNESPTRQQELIQKEKLIRSLHSEIEQLKQAERLANLSTDEVNRKLLDKEREVKQTKLEVESLHRRTRQLELKLELQAREVSLLLACCT